MFAHNLEDSNIRRTPQAQPTFNGIRRYNRCQMTLDVVVQDQDGWEIPLESVDISPTGIFVRSNFLFEVGEVHTLIFEVQGKGLFRVQGRVARVEEPDAQADYAGLGGLGAMSASMTPGMGYEFIETHEKTWQDLCAVVAGV
ncbi:PilZ domain-containing protein [Bradymonas sediminis]|nr:PilZ domain-containing protein [Bradymonas sediminis]TDP71932.1 PilZ domain-containing protein [Bradymonas sediminis]